LNVGFLRTFKEINNVVYDPKPNNPAHSLVLFKPENYEQAEPEIIVKIRGHTKDYKVKVNMEVVKERVEKQRK